MDTRHDKELDAGKFVIAVQLFAKTLIESQVDHFTSPGDQQVWQRNESGNWVGSQGQTQTVLQLARYCTEQVS
jgi:hypothetical protein